MRGLGRHTKRGSGYIIAGVVGGACVPPLTGVANDRHGNGIGMVVPLVFLTAALTYALACNTVPSYKKAIDSLADADIGLRGENSEVAGKVLDEEKPGHTVEEDAAVSAPGQV